MTPIVRFEQLEVWRRARVLAVTVYRLTAEPPLRRDFGLTDQLRRAAVSVMANLAEGFESNSLRSFLRYIRIAQASLAELRCHLYLIEDAGLGAPAQVHDLRNQIERLGRMLGGLVKALNAKVKRGDHA